jgi:NADPH:quinone reductase-like Zn-dependent oxidoreductase
MVHGRPAVQDRHVRPSLSLTPMRAVQITRFGGPEVLDIIDIAEPKAGPGQKLYDISAVGVNYADTHHSEGASP